MTGNSKWLETPVPLGRVIFVAMGIGFAILATWVMGLHPPRKEPAPKAAAPADTHPKLQTYTLSIPLVYDKSVPTYDTFRRYKPDPAKLQPVTEGSVTTGTKPNPPTQHPKPKEPV